MKALSERSSGMNFKTENCGWISPEGQMFEWSRRGRIPIARELESLHEMTYGPVKKNLL